MVHKSLAYCPHWNKEMHIWYSLVIAPSPLVGEGWDEGDTPHLNPLPQGEKKAFSSVGGAPPGHENSE